MSTDADPARKVRIASCSGWTSSNRDFTRYPSQKSATIQLQAGQRYYIEALHKQNWGPGYLAVAWTLPDGTRQEPIPGANLIPYNVSASTSSAATEGANAASALRTAVTVYPNPLTGRDNRATVEFRVEKSGPVTLSLFSLQGQRIRTLYTGTAEAGAARTVALEAAGLAEGVYLVRLVTPTKVVTQKLLYTR
ncbi:T9SS type A sorting domain-containing protein [Hymenobacter humi]|uniref:T9SS type A sorting domain-containing protein n=1 Tax=Hymenobacter humi TaxID=1411620 RepID=A0ABW2UC22_9BACT